MAELNLTYNAEKMELTIYPIDSSRLRNITEVVRCKDCKHYHHYGDDVYGCRTFGIMKTKPDGFCSYGERKDNDSK